MKTLLLALYVTATPASPVPQEFQAADLNQNQLIEYNEIITCIEDFFYGNRRFSERELIDLIDYFLSPTP